MGEKGGCLDMPGGRDYVAVRACARELLLLHCLLLERPPALRAVPLFRPPPSTSVPPCHASPCSHSLVDLLTAALRKAAKHEGHALAGHLLHELLQHSMRSIALALHGKDVLHRALCMGRMRREGVRQDQGSVCVCCACVAFV